MRIGKVIGRVTLSQCYPSLQGGRYVVVLVQDRFALAGLPGQSRETLVVYDNLVPGEGQLIGFAESREACMPFYPEKLLPLDAYNGAILDAVVIEQRMGG